ncbi:hypothetical protein [Achromobacter phage Motura]|uniref:Uncharacterized protein n=1 Tax=Achromobacter phage Motura TaxID=2591403 RepID=A0A514CSP6_9CAUD|nr:hypothetical protein H1O15_gp310 [Achromobacter phage Motura]QDH83496.1 hypothetical protein [Achromobacter phage Motura]
MSALTKLKEVRQLLAEPSAWRQDNYAGFRQEDGTISACSTESPNANCFCILGALIRVGVEDGTAKDAVITQAIRFGIDILYPQYCTISEFNDAPGRTHKEVLEVLDVAEQRLQVLGII